jgi:WD40 repeat protein
MDKTPSVKVLILDACRNWPLLRDGDRNGFLEQLDAQRIEERQWDNLLVAYSTSSGDQASDGPAGANSRFCEAFCNAVNRHKLSIEDCFKEVGLQVIRHSERRQRPWSYSSLNISTGFSDLPRFELVESHRPPLGTDVPLSLSPGPRAGSVLACGGTGLVWKVSGSGFSIAAELRIGTVVAAAARDCENIVIVDVDGLIWDTSNGRSNGVNSGISDPFGLRYSRKNGDLIVFGRRGWGLYRNDGSTWHRIAFRKTRWTVQAGTFVGPTCAWFAGSKGHIVEVDWATARPIVRALPNLPTNVNVLVPVPDGRVGCAGTSGLLVLLDRQTGNISMDFQQSKKVVSARARRGSLLNIIGDDERISRFIFHPQTLSEEVRGFLEYHLNPSQLIACHAAPSLPILAVGSDEGIVSLIDLRDGQVFQTIDAAAGRGQDVEGLYFANDSTFVVLSKDAVVSFYSSGNLGPIPAGPFLISEEEDHKMIE